MRCKFDLESIYDEVCSVTTYLKFLQNWAIEAVDDMTQIMNKAIFLVWLDFFVHFYGNLQSCCQIVFSEILSLHHVSSNTISIEVKYTFYYLNKE